MPARTCAKYQSLSHTCSVRLEKVGRAEWHQILRGISRPTREQSASEAESASSEEEVEAKFTKSNLAEIIFRNRAATKINKARKKTTYNHIKPQMASPSRLDWHNGEGYCEVNTVFSVYAYIIRIPYSLDQHTRLLLYI